MGYNIYDEQPAAEKAYKGGGSKETSETIFMQHAVADGLSAGTPFKNACVSLSRAFPELKALENEAIEGRTFTFFDEGNTGILSKEEFVNGVEELLKGSGAAAQAIQERLRKGAIPSFVDEFNHVKKVAIIGAGVAGLQTARQLTKVGIDCVIFEKEVDVGGVWRKNYADFGLQVPKELYEFPEYPYPEGTEWEDFPHGPQVQEYIQRYAKEFGLYDMVRFETGVHDVSPVGTKSRDWRITFSKKNGPKATEDFNFVVVATGMYGWPPHIPLARGSEKFKGKILHSCTFTDKEVAKGKKVVTVGGGKSAVDNAVAAGKVAKESTLLFREAHWPVPRKLLNLVPFKWGTYSRFGHFMLPTHHKEPACSWWFHSTCAPVKWVWWRVVELMFRGQFHLTGDSVPKVPIEIDVFNGGQILTYEYRDAVAAGNVKAMKGSIESYYEDGVVLMDGTKIECDMVIYGTGFKKQYDWLDRVLQAKLNLERDGLYLYRSIIPPKLPDMAFIGCEVSTFNNVLTHGLQALWLQKVLTGDIKLPKPGAMSRQIELEQAWKRSWMPASSARASIWQLHMMKYHDILMKDMGERQFRKFPNIAAEAFAPYQASDYRPLFTK